MSNMHLHRYLLVLVAALPALACQQVSPPAAAAPMPAAPVAQVEGASPPAARPAPPVPAIDTAPVFATLPAPKLENAAPYHFKEGVKVVPRAGEKSIPFPPPQEQAAPVKPVVAEGELRVTRHQPDGAQGVGNVVSATFNQPMVPLSDLATLKQLPVPLQLEPLPPGKFRWLGTSTVTFEAQDRLPFATTYRATIPAGVASATGAKLAGAVSWTFETPLPKIDAFEPGDNDAEPDQLIHVRFNQAISPQRVAEQLKCTAGKRSFALKLSAPEKDPFQGDASSDLAVKKRIFEERNVFLRPVEKLPLDSEIVCVLPKGFRGAEGPNPTTVDQGFRFRTYAPFRFLEADCGYNGNCPPGSYIQLRFNNPTDAEQDLAERIHVKPDVSELMIGDAGGPYVSLTGGFLPATTYTITIDGALADRHHQKLGQAKTASITIGHAEPALAITGAPHAVIERDGPRLLPIAFTRLTKARLRVFKLEPGKLADAVAKTQQYVEPGKDPFSGFTASIDRTLNLGAASDAPREQGLSTDELLGKGGTGLFLVDLDARELCHDERWCYPHRSAVVQVTDLGLTAHLTDEKAVVLVASLSSGKPVAGARVQLMDHAGKALAQATTDAHGLAELPGPRTDSAPFLFVAEKDSDRAALINDNYVTGDYVSSFSSGGRPAPGPFVVASVFTDRQPYRPGDTVHLAGVVRMRTRGPNGTISALPAGTRFKYELTDPRGQKVSKGEGELGPGGLVAVDLKLAADASLGAHNFQATLTGGAVAGQTFETSFDVQEYRTPEYKVSIDTGEPRHFVGDQLRGQVIGEYFFGGAMANAPANWRLSRSSGTFTPPNAPAGYTFGEGRLIEPMYFAPRFHRAEGQVATGSGVLDAQGRLAFSTRLDAGDLTGPVSFNLEADVTDANRQQIHANASLLAHSASTYAGLKLDRIVVKAGETVGIQVVALDIDGKVVVPRGAQVELVQRTWTRVKASGQSRYERKEEVVGHCALTAPRAAGEAATCRTAVAKAGDYLVRATIKDAQGRSNRTSVGLYAYGPGAAPWYRPDQKLEVELIADQSSYAPGSTARVLVKSPFPHSTGLVAIDREGLVEYRPLEFDGATTVVEVPLSVKQVPNVHVNVALVRGRISPAEAGAAEGDPDDIGRPMYAGGTTSLAIDLIEHKLNVAVSPSKPAVAPGDTLDLRVQTTDGRGAPASARLVVAVVDEGVLSLEGYALPNPLTQIFANISAGAGNTTVVPLVIPREAKLTKLSATRGGGRFEEQRLRKAGAYAPHADVRNFAAEPAPPPAPMAAKALGSAQISDDFLNNVPVMTARSFFATTAYFSAKEATDTAGKIDLHIKMPENLTSYRIMVVAVGEGERFGSGDGSVQIRKPLLVRPSLPRYLNLGDAFLASAVLNNQTDADFWVDAEARVANGKVDGGRKRVLVRAGEAKEVAFEAHAGAPGVSRWQFAAVALDPQRHNDAAELDVPVALPATAEAFATYGTTDKSVLQPLKLPKDALPDFGRVEVSLSSTALTGLADAVVYLHDYPYECVEQTSSRILPFAVLKPMITDFHISGAGTSEQRDKLVREGVQRILAKQRNDGGFGYWSDSRDSYLYVSAWAGYVLNRVQKAGYEVDANALRRLTDFLRNRLENPRHDLGEDIDFSSQAMAALTLGVLGEPQAQQVKRIYGHRAELPLYGKAWLMEAAFTAVGKDAPEVTELNRQLQNAAVQKASSAHFAEATSESIRLLMHSNERTDAIVLTGFLHVRPKDPLVPKIIHGLNESRRHGRWDTTQSNAWATVAMADYYAAYEKAVPNFTAQLFVGDALAGTASFKGRSTDTLIEKIPLSAVASQKDTDLTLAKEGAGRLYYRLGLRYAPKSLKLAPEEQGFSVTRTYLPMDGSPDSVVTEADGSVRIKAGSNVRVKLQIVVRDRAEFVAVDDPLPAGLEAVNTSFLTNRASELEAAGGTDVERTGMSWWRWWWDPFNHTELKDDRVVLFADQLPAGVYTHTYVARATTLGTFQVPPARAFEMYEPENFGRTASTVVQVR